MGDTQIFTAKAVDEQGNEIPITPTWSTTGGEITPEGLYTASEEGDFVVTASVQGSQVQGSADVHVNSSPEDIRLDLIMPALMFHPGLLCFVDLRVQNFSPDHHNAMLFLAMTFGSGVYLFYPSWCTYPDELDWEDMSIPENSDSTNSIIPEFPWPENCGHFAGALIIAAMVSNGELVSNLEELEFGWTETLP